MSNQASVWLNKGRRPRLEEGHPWIYANEIAKTEGEATPGQLLEVKDHRGQLLGTGYWNPASQITVRMVAYGPLDKMDIDFFRKRFERASAHRTRFLGEETSCRLVYGEADFLPGLVVDRFNDILVVQVLTLGMEIAKEAWLQALIEVFAPSGIYERSDVGVRTLEGLEERTGVLYGECPRLVEIVENGLKVQVDIEGGQKTGYFFDQRENRASIKPLVKGWGARSGIKLVEQLSEENGVIQTIPVNEKGSVVTFPYWDGATVLECFAHTGSFTLHACDYGAKKVTCLDISEHALQTARHNVEINGFTDRVEFVAADAFDYLRQQVAGRDERQARANAKEAGVKVDTSKPLTAEGRTWDVIILDPPAFAKTKRAVEGACRGYKDINLHAMKLLNEGGYLVTASCSYHVRPELFLETIQDAAKDAGKIIRRIEWRGAGKDHPQLAGVEEGHYLKFGIFEVRSRKDL